MRDREHSEALGGLSGKGQEAAHGAPDSVFFWTGGGGGVKKVGRDGWAAFPGVSRYLSRCESVYSQRPPLLVPWPGGASS